MRVIFVCIFCFIPGLSHAWTENVYRGILADAVALMPENIQLVVVRYQKELIRGVHEPWKGFTNRAQHIDAVIKETKRAVRMLTKNKSYRDAVRIMGHIAKLVAVLNHPLGPYYSVDNPVWPTDYDIYIEKNRRNFRIRWSGIRNRPGNADELSRLLEASDRKTMKTSRILIDILRKNKKDIAAYDVRSIPFGVASMTYSRAVSTTALSWLYLWDQAGGVPRKVH